MSDSYQVMLDQLDEYYAKNVDANEIAWLQTARQLDRTIAAGKRMATYLMATAQNGDKYERDEIGSLMNAWNHAINTR